MGLFGDDGSAEAANRLAIQNRNLYSNLDLPDLTWNDIEAQTISPESAEYQLIADNPTLRAEQEANLNKLKGLSETGLSDVDQAGFEKARALGNQLAQGQTQAAIQDAQNRGVAGSGLEFAMREAAAQNGATRAQDAGLQQAATAAQQRALYNQAFGSQLSNVRGQDLSASSANSGIINQFNQANTNARNQAQIANKANLQNTQTSNQQSASAAKQQNYGNQLQKVGGITGANNQLAQNYLADSAAKTGQANALIGAGAQLGAAYFTGGASLAAKNKTAGARGGLVPNHSAHKLVPGDHPLNDIIDLKASPGEMLIPRSHMSSEKKANQFVHKMFKKPETVDVRMHALKKMAIGV